MPSPSSGHRSYSLARAGDYGGQDFSSIVDALCDELEGLTTDDHVLVIGTATQLRAVDLGLRRAGRGKLGAGLIALWLALLLGFGQVIQEDYRQGWVSQRRFWSYLVAQIPDVRAGTVVLVEPLPLGDVTQIGANTWNLPRVLEQLDHQQGRGAGDDDADVQRRVGAVGQQAAADAQPHQQLDRAEAEQGGQRDLQQTGDDDRLAAGEDLLEVDFEADQKEQHDEPELGDGVDVGRIGHLLERHRPDQYAGQQEGRDARNPQAREEHAEGAGRQQADADVVDQ